MVLFLGNLGAGEIIVIVGIVWLVYSLCRKLVNRLKSPPHVVSS